MESKGSLHVDEEFGRAKRNLLWFCLVAILLWFVRVPESGTLELTIFGGTAKLDAAPLRVGTWLICVYCLVGFYRQVRNVERINSETIYTLEFDDIRGRLSNILLTFQNLENKAAEVERKLPEKFVSVSSWEIISQRLANLITRAFADIDAIAKEVQRTGVATQVGLSAFASGWTAARSQVEVETRRIFEELRDGASSNERESAALNSCISEMSQATSAIIEMRLNFHRLSNQIFADHQVLYRWYDKYLSYGMFGLATIATAWALIKAAALAVWPLAVNAFWGLLPAALATGFLFAVHQAGQLRTRFAEKKLLAREQVESAS